MLLDERKNISVTHWKYFLSFITVVLAISGVYAEPTRQNLIHYLLNESRYDHSLPPDFDKGNVTNVSVEMVITDLDYESDINMDYECTLYLHLNWTDRRLDFTENDTSYECLKLGDDIVDKIWIPDLYFYHERKSELHGLFTKNQLVYIYRNGSVVYSGRFSIKSSCQMNLEKYPFDIQTCPIVIQSYAFTTDDLLLHWNGKNAVKIDHAANLNYIKQSQEHTYDSQHVDSVGNFSTLVAKISYTRPKESFQVMYIAPPIILVTVSLCSFLLGDSVQARIIVPTGALTQLIMQWAGIYNKLPPVPVLIQLDIWMLANLVYVGLVLMTNAVICHFKILKDKEVKGGNEEGQSKKDTVSSRTASKILGDNDNVLGDKSGELLPSNSNVKHPKPENRLDGDGDSSGETSPLLLHEQRTYKALEVAKCTENGVIGDDVMETSYSNPAFTEPAPSSKNEKGEDGYVTVLVKSGRKEPENETEDLDELKEDFLELLDDSEGITTATDWQVAAEIVKGDPHYQRVCKYGDTISQWYKEHIDEKKKKDFLSLLEAKARKIKDWKRAERKIDHDSRYVVVDGTEREKLFEDYRQRQCLFTRIKSSQNVRSVNFICFVLLALLYGIFVIGFYCDWSSDIR